LAPAARLVPQLFEKAKEDAFVPPTTMLEIDSAVPPVLVMVTDCEALAVPIACIPNARLVVESKTAGGVKPVPVSVTVCGEPGALSVMVTAAESAPANAGVKWPCMEQFAPAARLLPQEFVNTNEGASAPVTAMLVIDNGASPVLVKVTDCDALDVPTSWDP